MPAPDTLTGPAIVTRYLGGSSRIVATHKRDAGETERLSLPYSPARDSEGNHRAAAEALAERMGHGPRVLVARGHDADCYVWVSVGLWQVESAALALAACRELLAALAGGGDAESLALPAALALQATGAAPVHPTVDGWILGPAHPGPVLIDCLGRPIEGLSFGGELSPAGALAAAAAAGWPLTAPAAHTAGRLQGEPDPAAVAQALAARGGCPAAVATLKGQGVVK
jgi:hypothetical protein